MEDTQPDSLTGTRRIRIRRKAALLLGSLLAVSAAGESAAPAPNLPALPDLPKLTVPRVIGPVTLDGRGGDPAWNFAAVVELRDYWQQVRAEAFARTRVSLLHDGATLYVAFDCEDRDVRAIRTARNDHTFRDDCVEILLGAARERLSDTVGLEINALGTLADFYYRHADWINSRFRSEAEIAVSRSPLPAGMTGYRVEVAIPFASLEPVMTLPGPKWEGRPFPREMRANFARWDRGEEDCFSIWSDPRFSFPHPHRPERYGWLTLADEITRPPVVGTHTSSSWIHKLAASLTFTLSWVVLVLFMFHRLGPREVAAIRQELETRHPAV